MKTFIYICAFIVLIFVFGKFIPETPYNTNEDNKQIKHEVKQEEKQVEHDFNQDAINIQTMFSGL